MGESFVVQPKVNADVEANQIKIKLISNDALKAKGGYVKYHFTWQEGSTFENNFDPKKESEEFIHTFEVDNIARWMKLELSKKKIDVKLKKKKAMFYKTTLDE